MRAFKVQALGLLALWGLWLDLVNLPKLPFFVGSYKKALMEFIGALQKSRFWSVKVQESRLAVKVYEKDRQSLGLRVVVKPQGVTHRNAEEVKTASRVHTEAPQNRILNPKPYP